MCAPVPISDELILEATSIILVVELRKDAEEAVLKAVTCLEAGAAVASAVQSLKLVVLAEIEKSAAVQITT